MLSYIVLFSEYILTRGKGLIINLIIGLIFSVLLYYLNTDLKTVIEISSSSINLLGILLGFTISLFAIILSVENDIIRQAKIKKLKNKIKFYKDGFSLFDSLIINIAFVIILLSLLLIYNFLLPLLFLKVMKTYLIYFVLNIGLIIFAILELVNSILNYYFLVTKNNE